MRIPSVKTIRRVLVGVIGVVALAALINYLSVALRQPRGDGKKPSMISADFRRAAEAVEILFRKGSERRFTIRARSLRETIQDRSFLEEIEASDFNRDGSVRNSIYSDGAVYDPGRKTVDFDGDVRLLLDDGVELRAEALYYNLETEIGVIPGMMEFLSNSVSGRSRGVRFFRDEDRLELDEEVDFSLARGTAETAEGAIRASAARGTCLLAENRILFSGGVRIESLDIGTLSADAVDIRLSPDRSKITYMTASGKVAYERRRPDETRSISGGRMQFIAGTTGALEKALISEHAYLLVKSADGERTLRAGEIEISLDTATGAISEINGTAGADFLDRRGADETVAAGDAVYAEFAEADGRLRNVRLSGRARFALTGTGMAANELRADAIEARFCADNEGVDGFTASGGARLTLNSPGEDMARTLFASKLKISYDGNYPDSGEASGAVTLEESGDAGMIKRLNAERIRFNFFPGVGQIKNFRADDGVHIVYERAASSFINSGIERYQTSSDSIDASFVLVGGTGALWRATQRGNFRFISEGRSASADHGEYYADNEKFTLTGSPEILYGAGRINGELIEYDLGAGELLAKGSVRAVIDARQGKSALFHTGVQGGGASPVVITSKELHYRVAEESFQFSGDVAALTESQQLGARIITIGGNGNMTADGGVLHRIHETGEAAIIESGRMEYRHDEGIIRYSGKVEVKSREMTFSADRLNVTLDNDANNIRRVLAEENVLVVHDGRVCSGDSAEWIPASSGYVVTGNPATVDDPVRGRSTARRLTYFREMDRITLDPNGSAD